MNAEQATPAERLITEQRELMTRIGHNALREHRGLDIAVVCIWLPDAAERVHAALQAAFSYEQLSTHIRCAVLPRDAAVQMFHDVPELMGFLADPQLPLIAIASGTWAVYRVQHFTGAMQ